MSSQNNEADGAAMGIVVLLLIAYAVAIVSYVILVFFSLLFTIWAIAAWNKPVTLFGETVEPKQARWYIGRGIAGAYASVLIAKALGYFFDFTVPDEYEGYIALGGYALASLFVESILADLREKAEAEAALAPPIIKAAPPPRTPPPKSKPAAQFEYASWDDEEARP